MNYSIISHLQTIIAEKCQELAVEAVDPTSIPGASFFVSVPLHPNNISLVLFDIYGTLLHSRMGEISLQEQAQAVHLSIPEIGITLATRNIQNSIQKLIAKHHILQKKAGCKYPEVNIIEIWKEYSVQSEIFQQRVGRTLSHDEAMICALRFELAVNPVSRMPHAMSCLHTLQERNLQLGIISNAQFYTPLILNTIYGKDWEQLRFSCQIWSWELLRAKPAQELFQKALASCSCRSEQAVYIGNDVKKDIIPAKSLGMHTVLFAGDTRSLRTYNTDISSLNPSSLILSLSELPYLL